MDFSDVNLQPIKSTLIESLTCFYWLQKKKNRETPRLSLIKFFRKKTKKKGRKMWFFFEIEQTIVSCKNNNSIFFWMTLCYKVKKMFPIHTWIIQLKRKRNKEWIFAPFFFYIVWPKTTLLKRHHLDDHWIDNRTKVK